MEKKISKFSEEQLNKIISEFKKESKLYEYRTKDYPFEVIHAKFGDEEDLTKSLYVPAYQREFVWKPDKQSLFIESVLLGVPLSPFLVSDNINDNENAGRLEIVDGSQRIRTLIAFYENKLRLIKLDKLKEINSAKFKDLPKTLQSYLYNRDFRIIVVENAEIEIRKDLYKRINTTSEPLSDAEIRRGSYSGDFYDLVIELSKNVLFKEICPISEQKNDRGEGEELVLRFFAYIDNYLQFKHDVAFFLNDYLDDKNEKGFDESFYKSAFLSMVNFVKENYPLGFRKEENSNSTPRVRFEAISVGTYLAIKENDSLQKPNMEWLYSSGFKIQTTSDASNNPDRLKNRIEFVRDGLLGKLDTNRLQNG
uniref:GmrSD restriction endonucleases N-terminal domain-containing protein n=1 Tax=Chlorobium chlorochromatii (strain CaD3) TaxID=340177 RepID=Q3AQ43_CHLCH